MARQEGTDRNSRTRRGLQFAGWAVALAVAVALLADAPRASADAGAGATAEATPVSAPVSPAPDADAAPRKLVGGGAKPGTLASAREQGGMLGEVIPTALALGATILVIVLARSAVKRFGGQNARAPRPAGVVEVLARYPIARGQTVVLLKVADRVIVTHQGAQGMQTLSVFESAAESAEVVRRCEAGAKASRDFSFDAILRGSSRAFDAKRAPAREGDPFAGAEVEMVDLTRRPRGGARR
ncbi:MAG: flagellar biosynthetic protein FliO [Planctomycetota bacterium]